MIETTEADDAWCPPTFDFSGFGRTLLAWWIIECRKPEDAALDLLEDGELLAG